MKSSFFNWNEHSKYWLDDDTYRRIKTHHLHRDGMTLDQIVDKSKIKKTIQNFVHIISEKQNISVKFAGTQSHTDGKEVTISADVEDYDLICGLSLHEASHILYSTEIFKFFDKIEQLINCVPANSEITISTYTAKPNTYKLIGDIATLANEIIYKNISGRITVKNFLKVFEYIKLITNFIEDVRIDTLVQHSFPGYKGYYDALNKRYVLSDQTRKHRANATTEEVQSYLIHLISLLDPEADLDILKGLRKINELIDIPNISRLTGSYDVWYLAMNVFKEIIKNVQDNKNNQSGDDQSQDENKQSKQSSKSKSTKSNEKSNDKSPNLESLDENETFDEEQTSNDDEGETSDEGENETSDEEQTSNEDNDDLSEIDLSDNDIDEISDIKEMKEVFDAINNEYKKKALSGTQEQTMDLIESGNIKSKKVDFNGEKVSVLLITDISDPKISTFAPNLFSSGNFLEDRVKQGMNKGKVLAKRLSLLDDIKLVTTTRKEAGQLDQRLLPEFGSKNTKIFKTFRKDQYEDMYVHISIDNSGSMNGEPWYAAIEMAAMFATASKMIKGLNVEISIRSTMAVNNMLTTNSYASDCSYIAIIFDSKINGLEHIKKYWPKLRTTGLTPEGLTFSLIKDHMIEYSKGKSSYFINVSDGEPYYAAGEIYYSGTDAIKHSANQVRELQKAGFRILSYFTSGDNCGWSAFQTIYGKNSMKVDIVNPMLVANSVNRSIKKV